MKLNKLFFLVLILLLVASCGDGGSSGGSGSSTATLSSITVTPANPRIYYLKATEQFTATGTYSDNTTKNITTSVAWSSSSAAATISNTAGSNGMVTALAAGTTTIAASLESVSGSTVLTVIPSTVIPNNVLTLTVNGSLCSTGSYPNKPCVSVTVCSPSTAICQTINDILLDTGSYGLRIFKSVLTGVSLTQIASGSGSLTECVQYADGSADWGPVQTAVVVLGNEPAVTVPIQVIDATFGTTDRDIRNLCGTPDTGPSVAGFNGILGVGPFAEDCGSECTPAQDTTGTNGTYYSCNGSSCTGTAIPLSSQVKNPVVLLPLDNNGVIVQLPGINIGGSPSVNGFLVLGIDTQSNNGPLSGVKAYATDQNGDFTTTFQNIPLNSFIDIGSNGLFFPSSHSSSSSPPYYDLTAQIPDCTYNTDWFCPPLTPPSTVSFSAYTPNGKVNFQIGNADTLFSSSNNVFDELGGSDTSFDWGLPFFLGRSVYVGIEGKTSSLGTGPYCAY